MHTTCSRGGLWLARWGGFELGYAFWRSDEWISYLAFGGGGFSYEQD